MIVHETAIHQMTVDSSIGRITAFNNELDSINTIIHLFILVWNTVLGAEIPAFTFTLQVLIA